MSAAAPPDAAAYRKAIGLFATGVAVVACRAGDEHVALTVNAVTSVSLEPLLVLFCPGQRSRLARHIDALNGFTINLLRHEQRALSTYFAGAWKEPQPPPHRFVPSRSAMRLEGCLASIDCATHSVTAAGDHWMVLGRVLELHVGVLPHRPLLFYGGQYRELDPGDRAPAPDLTDVHDEPAHIAYHFP